MRANAALWTVLAAIVIAIAGPIVAFILMELSRAPDMGSAADVFHDWQGILGGLLALVGAAAAASVVVLQIEETRNIEEERRARRAQALWATMPHEFGRPDEHIDTCRDVITDILKSRGQNIQDQPQFGWHYHGDIIKCPDLPIGFVGNLRQLIEVCQSSEVFRLTEYSMRIQPQNVILKKVVLDINTNDTKTVIAGIFVDNAVNLAEIKFFNDELI
jgi:hypothetical protein